MEFKKQLIAVLIYVHLQLIRSSILKNDTPLEWSNLDFENNSHVFQLEDDGYTTKERFVRQNEFINNIIKNHYPLPGGTGKIYKQYDFIIIGGGSAGCTLASRLSENSKWTVLLLEAGDTETALTDIPLMAPFLLHTGYSWGYETEKRNDMYRAFQGSRGSLPRGKILGGSSVINFMVYTRGNRIDWDRIAEAGNSGWSYDEVLPYFIKSEKSNLKHPHNSTYHSKRGLMSVEHVNYKTPLIDAFLDSGKKLGHKTIDYNSDERIGFGYVQATTLNGRRHSTARAFLFPFKDRINLHILTRATVTKININPANKKAESVEFVYNKVTYTVGAKKEIILSAGCIASPQLLMLSGVGPKEHLRKMNIPVIQDLRVGQNVYDHLAFLALIFTMNTTGIAITPNNLNIQNMKEWLVAGKGPLSLPSGVEGLAFVKTSVSEEEHDHPDIELVVSPISLASQKQIHASNNALRIEPDYFSEAFGDATNEETFSIAPILLHTRSKGQITLKDKNPFRWPQVTYDYFEDKRDLKTMIEGIKYAIKVGMGGKFKKIGSRLYEKKLPSCLTLEFGSDQYWECALRSLATSMQHHVGSCRMGPASDPEAVVDHHLRVYGVQSLRVGDVGVIPIPLAAHTNAAAVMVGENLADILKADWN